jgi:hypothetical protein
MAIIIGIAVLIIIVLAYRFASAGRNPAWDNDPSQLRLIELFIADARDGEDVALVNFICQQCWSGKELRNRIIHALNRVRLLTPPAVFKKAKKTGHRLSMESYQYD